MTGSEQLRSFLTSEIEGLEPLGYVVISAPSDPLQVLETTRLDTGGLEVRVPGRPPILPELEPRVRAALRERGFASEAPDDRTKPWVHAVDDAAAAVDLAARIFEEVYARPFDHGFDVAHGSHRAEYEAQQRLAAVRERIEKIAGDVGGKAPEQDADGDYVLGVGDVHLTVAPRAIPEGPVVVRVFAITNVGVTVSPEVGLFLARLNFGLMFGRFALDGENRSIWFDENLIGEEWSDEDLRFTIQVVASTADAWDDRMKQMFGGSTWQEVLTHRSKHEAPSAKPGQGPKPGLGGYL